MRSRLRRMTRLARAVNAMPRARLAARLRHEAKRLAIGALPVALRKSLMSAPQLPKLRSGHLAHLVDLESDDGVPNGAISLDVEILGRRQRLSEPIDWAASGESRLWRFTLHYFDWAVAAVASSPPATRSATVDSVFKAMSAWTSANPPFVFDAWHPYPTARRLIAWTLLMSAYPHRVTNELDRSLWSQVVYLSRNIEWFIGGNHLLQDLCSLLVAAPRYEGAVAARIVDEASRHLSEALPRQLTADGCHYEISGAYHLQVMVMVSQAMASLLSTGMALPASLVGCLQRMTIFAEWMRLPGGGYPMWGDSAPNSVEPLDEVLALARGVLRAAKGHVVSGAIGEEIDPQVLDEAGRARVGKAEAKLPFPAAQLVWAAEFGAAASTRSGRHSELSNTPALQKRASSGSESLPDSHQEMLGPSGLEILREGDFVVVVDAAATAPDDLPAHGHADSLNVDVYFDGDPVLIETGTSVYEAGSERDYERSTAAHNTVEIGGASQTEMWGSFRVGRLARTFNRASGEFDGWRWVTASHDGYVRNHGSVHSRWVGLRGRDVVVLDRISVTRGEEPVPFKARFHLAPNILAREVDDGRVAADVGEGREMVISFFSSASVRTSLKQPGVSGSWYSHGFGKRVARAVIEVSGAAEPGVTFLCTHMTLVPRGVEFVGDKEVIGLLEQGRLLVAWEDSGGQLWPIEPTVLNSTGEFSEVLTTRTTTSTSRLRKVLS